MGPMRADTSVPAPVAEAGGVLATFMRHPHVHPYGIADVDQLWHCSRWWRDGEAVAGVLDLPGSPVPVLYAVSADAGPATLDLLARIEPALPEHFEATAPRGLAARLSPAYRPLAVHDCLKMHLAEPARLPPPDPQAVPLDRSDLDALERLFATDPDAGDFFFPGLLDTGLYIGLRERGDLAACAGIHVVDDRQGVAAIGNVTTHPAHRRRGLARAVTATLCHRLLERVGVVGLNVREANAAAGALYASMGFRTVLPYEQAEVVRRRGSA